MLSDDEIVPDEPEPKKFEYYANRAETAIIKSSTGEPGSRYTEWQMNVAELYARLAAAAPK